MLTTEIDRDRSARREERTSRRHDVRKLKHCRFVIEGPWEYSHGPSFFGGIIYLGDGIHVRRARIDTPELRTRCEADKVAGYEARDALVERLSHATAIELREVKRGSTSGWGQK